MRIASSVLNKMKTEVRVAPSHINAEVAALIIGSFSIDDGNGNDNATN